MSAALLVRRYFNLRGQGFCPAAAWMVATDSHNIIVINL